MKKITIMSALIAWSVLGTSQAYALDEDRIRSGEPSACPIVLSITELA